VSNAAPEIILSGGPSVNVIIADGDSSPQTSDLTLFQTVLAADASTTSRTYRITNSGDAPLNVLAPNMGSAIIGDGASAFRFDDMGSFATKIEAGADDDFDIIFDPSEPGTYTATVIIGNNSEGTTAPYTFDIQGTATDAEGNSGLNITNLAGIPIPPGGTQPNVENSTDFGINGLGSRAIFKDFTILNASQIQQLQITGGVVIEHTVGSGFRVTSSPPSTIGVGQTAGFTIRLSQLMEMISFSISMEPLE